MKTILITGGAGYIGSHESGLFGKALRGMPNNLMPYVSQVAAGQREFLNVWGDYHSTIDGTGVRDYIHVCRSG